MHTEQRSTQPCRHGPRCADAFHLQVHSGHTSSLTLTVTAPNLTRCIRHTAMPRPARILSLITLMSLVTGAHHSARKSPFPPHGHALPRHALICARYAAMVVLRSESWLCFTSFPWPFPSNISILGISQDVLGQNLSALMLLPSRHLSQPGSRRQSTWSWGSPVQ